MELTKLTKLIELEVERIRILRTEWAFQTQPKRIQENIEKTLWCRIHQALRIHGSDPADRPGDDAGLDGIKGHAVIVLGRFEKHVSRFPLKAGSGSAKFLYTPSITSAHFSTISGNTVRTWVVKSV